MNQIIQIQIIKEFLTMKKTKKLNFISQIHTIARPPILVCQIQNLVSNFRITNFFPNILLSFYSKRYCTFGHTTVNSESLYTVIYLQSLQSCVHGFL
jgi:hypothetical protein